MITSIMGAAQLVLIFTILTVSSGLPQDLTTITSLAPGDHLRDGRSDLLTSLDFSTDGDDPAVIRDSSNMCGIRRSSVPDIFTRIVGGSTAEKHEFPWQASLQWRFSWYSYHVCGATILSKHWLVTAAHCTHQFKPSDIVIIAGVHNIKQRESTEQRRNLDRIAEHWGYNPSTQENDIALLRVSEPFIIDGMTVAPVCLPPANFAFKESCVVSGWGKLTENGKSADELRKVVVPIINREQCKESYRVIGYSGPISEKMLCAGYSQGVKDACQGDSGGPFVCRGQDNRFLIAGVVSWGVGCARPNVPGVYTEVSRYIAWISSVVHGRSEVTQRAVTVQTSLHLDDIHNVSHEISDVVEAYDSSSSSTTSENVFENRGRALDFEPTETFNSGDDYTASEDGNSVAYEEMDETSLIKGPLDFFDGASFPPSEWVPQPEQPLDISEPDAN